MEEIKRVVFSWRRLLVLLLLGVLCLVNLTRMSSWEGLGRAEVKMEQFLENHRGEPLEQLKELLDRIVENQSRSASNNMSYGLLRNQAEYLTGFSDRLAEIQAQAENMSTVSIFAGFLRLAPGHLYGCGGFCLFGRAEAGTVEYGLRQPVRPDALGCLAAGRGGSGRWIGRGFSHPA